MTAAYGQLADDFSPPRGACCLASAAQNLANQLLDWNFLSRYHPDNLALRAQPVPPGRVVFMGDSITDGWRNTGKAVFDQFYAPLKAANFGIGGDTTQGVLWRLQNGEGAGFKPKAIMLLIGTNNSGSGTSAEIAEGVGAVVLQLRTSFPDAKILLLAIFPRVDKDVQKQLVAAANPIIAKLHDGQHVFYLDIGQKFLAADGSISRDIMNDGLHPTAKGYQIWADAVKDQLAELMK